MSNCATQLILRMHIGEFASLIFGSSCGDKVISVITAYFDDSGTSLNHPALVMGGAIATVDNWIAFQEEWRSILEEYHLESFHMTDFDNKWGPFHPDKFREEARVPLITQLLAALKKRIQAIVQTGVNKKDYAAVQEAYGIKAYPFTAYECLTGVAQWADDIGYDGPIAYIFDKGGGSKQLGGKGTLDILKAALERDPLMKRKFRMTDIESWSYGYAKSLIPLQGADIIAYEAWKDLQNDYLAGRRMYWRKSAQKLITMERLYQGYFDAGVFAAYESQRTAKLLHLIHEGLPDW